MIAAVAVAAPAQQAVQYTVLAQSPDHSGESLPDSPGALWSTSVSAAADEPLATDRTTEGWQPAVVAPQVGKKYARTIGPGMAAEQWGAKEKFTAAFLKQVSIGGFASPVFVGAWQQARDSRPHYGTDSGAYGQRIGAAYARQSTQSFLNIGLMSSVLHDDPRYYVLGPTHTFKSRVIYAATRVLVTRKDDGSNAPNIPLFVGVVSSQALAEGFYPDQDQKWSRVVTGSLGSLAAKMASQQFKEFSAEVRQHIPFLKRNETRADRDSHR